MTYAASPHVQPAPASVIRDALMTRRITESGKAVVDCGATESIGGVTAIERLVELRKAADRNARVTVDTSDRPWYGFGNGASEQVLSRVSVDVNLGGVSGEFQVHALDKDNVPILASIATLRKLKAVIDFETGRAIFKELDDRKVIQLERAETGHLLLDLVHGFSGKTASESEADKQLRNLSGPE